MKLFGHDSSPYVRRIRVLTAELGIPCPRDTHGWKDAAPELQANSPIQRVPMLDRGADAKVRYVFESLAIAELLYAQPHGEPGGTPPFQRTLWEPALDGEDRNVLSVSDAGLDSLINVFVLELDGIEAARSPYLLRQIARARACLDWLQRVYAGRTTLSPGRLSYVDVSVLCALGWIRVRKRLDLAGWPGLLALEAAHAKRPSLVATHPGSPP